jgi:hypothetical protein
VCHTGATDCLYESLLNDTVLHVEAQFAGTLLRCAPADTVGITRDLLDFLYCYPFALLGDRSRSMISAFTNATHVFNFF